jgi:hypothetical protein
MWYINLCISMEKKNINPSSHLFFYPCLYQYLFRYGDTVNHILELYYTIQTGRQFTKYLSIAKQSFLSFRGNLSIRLTELLLEVGKLSNWKRSFITAFTAETMQKISAQKVSLVCTKSIFFIFYLFLSGVVFSSNDYIIPFTSFYLLFKST